MPLALNLNKLLILLAYVEADDAVDALVFVVCPVLLGRGGAHVTIWAPVTFLGYFTDSARVAFAIAFQWDVFAHEVIGYL